VLTGQEPALVDGNKRLALAGTWTFCFRNCGRLPDTTNDEAYELVMEVAAGDPDVKQVAEALRAAGIE
jgi:death-on-curing protein